MFKKEINRLNKFNSDRNWKKFHTPENIAKSISIEAAELLELYQWGGNWKELNLENVKEELADILIYCLLLSDYYNFDIQEIINTKININERKYPI